MHGRRGGRAGRTAIDDAGPSSPLPRAPAVGARAPHVVMVKRAFLASCMTCLLCKRLLRDATTISECLHTFCKKCIFEKLIDEEMECCPICNIDLGVSPTEKLRADHTLQDIRSKIFPLKRKTASGALETVPPMQLPPAKRKERSLSSLVGGASAAAQTGRRTRAAVARHALSLRGLSPIVHELQLIKKEVKKENFQCIEKRGEEPAGPAEAAPAAAMKKGMPNRRQVSCNAEPSIHFSPTNNKSTGKETKINPFLDKESELWRPLNCLVEAANRTKSSFKSPSIKLEQSSGTEIDARAPLLKNNVKNNSNDNDNDDNNNNNNIKNNNNENNVWVKRRRGGGQGTGRRKRRETEDSGNLVVRSKNGRNERRFSPIWFSLVASFDQKGDPPLPQIPSCYLRIRDGSIPTSFIQKYLVQKFNLSSESEVEIMCRGRPVSPTLSLYSLVDQWLRTGSAQRVHTAVGTSAKDFVMVLNYGRSTHTLSLHPN